MISSRTRSLELQKQVSLILLKSCMSNKFGSKSTEPFGFICRDKAVRTRLHVNTMTPYQLHTLFKHTHTHTHTPPPPDQPTHWLWHTHQSTNSLTHIHTHTHPPDQSTHWLWHTHTSINSLPLPLTHTHARTLTHTTFNFFGFACFNVNPENLFQGKQKETIQVYFLFHQWSKAFSIFFFLTFITVNNECKQWIIYHFLGSKWFRIPRIRIALLGEKIK